MVTLPLCIMTFCNITFIHPFHDVTFTKMELVAVIDKVTLDMGYESLKAKQKEAIMLFFFLQKRDVFVILPTGFGKGVSITSYCICVVIRVIIRLPGTV